MKVDYTPAQENIGINFTFSMEIPGPVNYFRRTMNKLGWVDNSPTNFTDHKGKTRDLDEWNDFVYDGIRRARHQAWEKSEEITKEWKEELTKPQPVNIISNLANKTRGKLVLYTQFLLTAYGHPKEHTKYNIMATANVFYAVRKMLESTTCGGNVMAFKNNMITASPNLKKSEGTTTIDLNVSETLG